MNNVRLGIIGMGNIGQRHAEALLAGQVSHAELTAIATTTPEKQATYHERGLQVFGDGLALIRSGAVDAVLIATPHYQHVPLGMACLEHGRHLLVEKPIAAHKADAERLIATHQRHPELQFAGMFQLRIEPRYQKIRELLSSGALGRMVRVNWINTDWFRTEAYYTSGDWRATWRGEGGGVLLNQSLHQLDLLQWLCGPPRRVRGFCQLGRYHPIEVEDNVTAYLEWDDGATGVFLSSTGETPGTNRLEITGTRGKLVLENDRLEHTQLAADMTEFSRTAPQGFLKPEATIMEIPFANAAAPHTALIQNFVDAIRTGTALIAPGAEGLASVELANAILYSSLQGQTIELPLDGAAWEQKLQELAAASTLQKTVRPGSAADFASSFKR